MREVIDVGIIVAVASQSYRYARYCPQDEAMTTVYRVVAVEHDVILVCPIYQHPADMRRAQVVAHHNLSWARDHSNVDSCYDWRDLATANDARTFAMRIHMDHLARYAWLDGAARAALHDLLPAAMGQEEGYDALA